MKHKTARKICNIGRRATAVLMAALISVNTIFAGGVAAFAEETDCSAEKRLELLETEESMEEVLCEIEEEYSKAREEYEAALEAYDEAYAAYITAEDDALTAEAAADDAKTALEEAASGLEEAESVNVSDMDSVLSEMEILEYQIEEAKAEAEELAAAAEAAQEVYNEAVSAYSEAQTALDAAEEEMSAAVEELSEAATTMASETEDLITDYENENNSLYALINWMLDGYEEYTKETLSDDQVTELTLSQSNLSAIMSGDSGWFNSSYSYSSDDIDPTSSTDALALTNVLTSLDIIDSINELRATDDNYVGYEDCLTNFVMMVGSAYTADVSIYQVAHVSRYTKFSYNENLAWGYSNPVSGWYTSEKALFDACRDELGYDVSDGEGLTSSEIRAVVSLASSYGYTVGHYTNLMYSSTQLVGVGYTTTRYLYRTTSSSNAAPLSKYTASYATDEMRSFITTYQEYLEDYEDSRITEAEALLDELETLVYYLGNTEQYTDIEEWIDLYASTAKSYMEDEIDSLINASEEYYNAEDTLEDLEESAESALADYEEALSEYESQLEVVELYEEQLAEKQEEYDTLEAERDAAIEEAQEMYDDACEAYTEAAEALEEAEALLAEAAEVLEEAEENLALAEAEYAELYDAYTEAYENYLEAYYARVDYEETANHSYDSGVVTKEATCMETGIITYTCTVCGVTKTETIEETDHSYDSGVVTKEATCMETGIITYTCTVCGITKTETIAKTNHTYSDTNECTVCGTVKDSRISDATVILSKSSYTYTGSEIKPEVTVTINKTTLVQGTDYTVSYSNNKEAGTATVTVTGKGSYSGTITATFTIKPARVIVRKAKSSVKKKITIKLKKVSGASYYKVQISKKKKFNKKNIILKKKITKNKKTIKSKKLKRKYKKLYVRARAVAVVNGKKYKGDWSRAKKVKKAK